MSETRHFNHHNGDGHEHKAEKKTALLTGITGQVLLFSPQLQKSCGYTGTTREEGFLVRKVQSENTT